MGWDFFFPLWEADAIEKEGEWGAVCETEESAAVAELQLGVNSAAGFEILCQHKLHRSIQDPFRSPAELLSISHQALDENLLCQANPFSQPSYLKMQNLKHCCLLAEMCQTPLDHIIQGL